MKTKFAMPTERDLRFVLHSGFKPEEFGEDFRIVTSAIDGLLIDCCDTDRDDIVSTDNGKRFPNAGEYMSTAEYLAAHCELNKVKT